jgi:hypothetical protein
MWENSGVNKHHVFLLIILVGTLLSCGQKDPCSDAFEQLKNPRLDFIADTIADVKAKGDLTKEDMLYIKQLQDEEDAIWRSAEAACKKI